MLKVVRLSNNSAYRTISSKSSSLLSSSLSLKSLPSLSILNYSNIYIYKSNELNNPKLYHQTIRYFSDEVKSPSISEETHDKQTTEAEKVVPETTNNNDSPSATVTPVVATSTPDIEKLPPLDLTTGTSNNSDISKLVKGKTGLEEIRLNNCRSITDEALKEISKNCPELKHISFSYSFGITDEGLKSIASGCKKLNKISLHQCKNITDDGVLAIVKGCNDLTSIYFTHLKATFSDTSVNQIADSLPKLKEIRLCSNKRITDDGLSKLVEKCKELEFIDIQGCNAITDASLKKIAENCPNLKKFYASNCRKITNAGLIAIIEKCTSLEEIKTSYCNKITDESILKLSDAKSIKFVDVTNCKRVTNTSINKLKKRGAVIKENVKLSEIDKLHKNWYSPLFQPPPTPVFIDINGDDD